MPKTLRSVPLLRDRRDARTVELPPPFQASHDVQFGGFIIDNEEQADDPASPVIDGKATTAAEECLIVDNEADE